MKLNPNTRRGKIILAAIIHRAAVAKRDAEAAKEAATPAAGKP
jgi:hypothetical protein